MLLDGCRRGTELATKGAQRASKAETLFPQHGGWGCAPQNPLQPSLSCRQAWEQSFPRAHPSCFGSIPSGKPPGPYVVTLWSPTARPCCDLGDTRAVHSWGRAHRHSFSPKKTSFFPPEACRVVSGEAPWLPGWWLQLLPVRTSQRSCRAVNRCLLSTQDTQSRGNFTPESQLVQIRPCDQLLISPGR